MIGLHYSPRTSWVDYFSPNRIICLFEALLEKNVLAVFSTSPQQKGSTELMMVCSTFSWKSFIVFFLHHVFGVRFLRDVSGWISDHHGRRMWEDTGFLWKVNSLGANFESQSQTRRAMFFFHPNDCTWLYISVYKIYFISWIMDLCFFKKIYHA